MASLALAAVARNVPRGRLVVDAVWGGCQPAAQERSYRQR
jgi:hypothetical protein